MSRVKTAQKDRTTATDLSVKEHKKRKLAAKLATKLAKLAAKAKGGISKNYNTSILTVKGTRQHTYFVSP